MGKKDLVVVETVALICIMPLPSASAKSMLTPLIPSLSLPLPQQTPTATLHPSTSVPKMSRQKTLFSVMAMVTVGASAFILPVRQPLHGPALCVRRASASTARFAVSQDELKKQVGYKSVDDYVTSGMVVGLGTGSTAAFAGTCVCAEGESVLGKDGWEDSASGTPIGIRPPTPSPLLEGVIHLSSSSPSSSFQFIVAPF